VKIKDALVNAHLPAVISVGTLTARRFADHQSKEFGGHSDGASDLKVLLKSLVLQLSDNIYNYYADKSFLTRDPKPPEIYDTIL